MKRLSFIGTALGMPIQSLCSSILLEEDSNHLLLDTGGGHSMIGGFKKVNKKVEDVQNIFITHYDSDHILGLVPIVRTWRSKKNKQKRNIFCSAQVKQAIESLFAFVADHHFEAMKDVINFILVEDRMIYSLGDWKVTFFDIHSNRTPQFGCRVDFADQTFLAFPGDEPIREHYIDLVTDCDVLVHEAFCLEKDSKIFDPHPKNHSTAKEAALIATKVQAKSLIVYHMEDTTLFKRKEAYTKEIQEHYTGRIFVPIDGDIYEF